MSAELGKMYKDTLTGCTGVATAKSEFLSGCTRILLESLKDNNICEQWLDENRLEGVEIPVSESKPGGPQPVPPNRDPIL